MIRKTSKTDARVRWYREYQRARNAGYQSEGAAPTHAFSNMPLRLCGFRRNRHGVWLRKWPRQYCSVDCSGFDYRNWVHYDKHLRRSAMLNHLWRLVHAPNRRSIWKGGLI